MGGRVIGLSEVLARNSKGGMTQRINAHVRIVAHASDTILCEGLVEQQKGTIKSFTVPSCLKSKLMLDIILITCRKIAVRS